MSIVSPSHLRSVRKMRQSDLSTVGEIRKKKKRVDVLLQIMSA